MPRTDRLVLRQWREGDREPFAALNADPEVMRHFPALQAREQSDALIDRASVQIAEHGWGLWAIEEAGTGAFLGFTGLAVPRFEASFMPAVEIGWRLRRDACGHGYASEEARAALEVAFGEAGLTEVVSFTAVGNERSRTVVFRIGMIRDPAEEFDHPDELFSSTYSRQQYEMGGFVLLT